MALLRAQSRARGVVARGDGEELARRGRVHGPEGAAVRRHPAPVLVLVRITEVLSKLIELQKNH